MIFQFLIPFTGETPNVKFYDNLTQVGAVGGYAASEVSAMLYEVDVNTDLDAYDTEILRVVVTNPSSVFYIKVAVGETVTIYDPTTSSVEGLDEVAANVLAVKSQTDKLSVADDGSVAARCAITSSSVAGTHVTATNTALARLREIISGPVHHHCVISDSRFTRKDGPYGRTAFGYFSAAIGPLFGGFAGGGWSSPTAGTNSVTIQQSQQPFNCTFMGGTGTITENLTSQGPIVVNDNTLPLNFRRIRQTAGNSVRGYTDKDYVFQGASNFFPLINLCRGPITGVKFRLLAEGHVGGITNVQWTFPTASSPSTVDYPELATTGHHVVEHTKGIAVTAGVPGSDPQQYRANFTGAGDYIDSIALQWLNSNATKGMTLTSLSAGGAHFGTMLSSQVNAVDAVAAMGFKVFHLASGANSDPNYDTNLRALIEWINDGSPDALIFIHQSCYTPSIGHNSQIEANEALARSIALDYDNVIALDTYSYCDELGINSGAASLTDATDGIFAADGIHFSDTWGWFYFNSMGQLVAEAVRAATSDYFGDEIAKEVWTDTVRSLTDKEGFELSANGITAIETALSGLTAQIITQFDPNDPEQILVVRRDDYNVADGRQIDVLFTPPDDFDPTGSVGSFGAKQRTRATSPPEFVGSVTPVEISGQWYARVQFTSAQLTTPAGMYDCDIELKKNDRRITVFSGRIRVLQDYAQA